MRCYLFNLFSKALFCIFGHANQSHIREWVAQKIISDFACIKCTIACRSWPLPSTYFFLYSPLGLRFSEIFVSILSNFLSPGKLIQKLQSLNVRIDQVNNFAKLTSIKVMKNCSALSLCHFFLWEEIWENWDNFFRRKSESCYYSIRLWMLLLEF